MKRKNEDSNKREVPVLRQDISTEARINRTVQAAFEEAERRILDGSASDGLLQTFLKMGTPQARLDERKTAAEVRKLEAQADNYITAATQKDDQKRAIAAFTKYSTGRDIDYDDVVLIEE